MRKGENGDKRTKDGEKKGKMEINVKRGERKVGRVELWRGED